MQQQRRWWGQEEGQRRAGAPPAAAGTAAAVGTRDGRRSSGGDRGEAVACALIICLFRVGGCCMRAFAVREALEVWYRCARNKIERCITGTCKTREMKWEERFGAHDAGWPLPGCVFELLPESVPDK